MNVLQIKRDMQKKSHKKSAQVNTNYKPEIMKQYAIQLEVSNYYNRLSLCNNIKLYLMSLIFAWYGHFHFDHFMMFENIIRQPKITFPN